MEFVSNYKDILAVVGEVRLTPNGKGIQMSLPEQSDDKNATFRISRIVYGENQSGKRYIETVASKNGNFPTYGEASIPEILALAAKALEDLPHSKYTMELFELSERLKTTLDIK